MQSPRQESLVCHRAARALLAGLLVVVGAFVALIATPQNASAMSYRYWSYWIGSDSGWTYSSWGPASLRPDDGSVEGWRFGVSSGTTGAGLQPRATADFDRICADTPAEDGLKRVAVIIDPGLAGDAPDGESPGGLWAMCVSAPPSATGADILRSAASVRTQAGMVCGLAGYPARECAIVLRDEPGDDATEDDATQESPTPTTTTAPSPESSPPPSTVGTDTAPTSSAPLPTPTRSSPASPSPRESTSSEQPIGTAATERSTPPSDDASSPAAVPQATSTVAPTRAPTANEPSPEVSIVAAAVTGSGSGPGPLMAIIGVGAIAVIATLAILQRRRAMR